MSGPYEKFQDAFEPFQETLTRQVHDALAAFKQDLLQEVRQVAGAEPFAAEAFRQQLLTDMHSAFEKFREELAAALADGTPLPPLAHEKAPASKSILQTLKKYW